MGLGFAPKSMASCSIVRVRVTVRVGVGVGVGVGVRVRVRTEEHGELLDGPTTPGGALLGGEMG